MQYYIKFHKYSDTIGMHVDAFDVDYFEWTNIIIMLINLNFSWPIFNLVMLENNNLLT